MAGERLVLIEELPNLDAVQRMRLELGTTLPELVAERVEDARTEMREAMKLADNSQYRDLHVLLARHIEAIDDLRAVLAERAGT